MNNYAVSSDGIATALMDSASALMEGGNNLEQATALVAAANRVVQDPNSVGSALRTISLRLRGTSVEVLEEMGEETDGAVESFSKMQAKIKALSGIDIVDMNGAYKDTYTILKEIGEVWDKLDDMDQAALLELMAGKNRANTLAAILDNMEDLKGAYDTAMDAEGSALRENEAYLDSIQGRIDLFTNAAQTMWMNLLNSDAVKFFINLGTAAINFIDSIGALPAAIGGFVAFKSVLNTVKNDFAAIDKVFAKTAEEAVAASTAEATASANSTRAKMAEATATIGLNTAKKGSIASTIAETVATNAATVATKALAVAKALLKGLLVGGVTMVATAAFTALASAIDKAHKSQKELNESAQETINIYKSAKEELSETKDTINSLSDDFEKLSSGVDEFGNNISLSTAEYERYNEIVNKIADMFPEMVAGYTEEGNAILSCKGNVDALTEAYEAQAQAARQATIAGSSDVFDAFKTNYAEDSNLFWKDTGLKQQAEMAQQVVDLLNSGNYDELNDLFNKGENSWNKNYNVLSDLWKSVGIDPGDFWNGFTDEADMDELKKQLPKLLAFIKSSDSKIKAEANKVTSIMDAFIGEDEDYQNLDAEYQQFIDRIVSNLDAEFLNKHDSAESVYAWIRTNYIEPFSDPKLSKEFSATLNDMFDLQTQLSSGDISLDDYRKEIKSFIDGINSLNLDDDAVKQIVGLFELSPDNPESFGRTIDAMIGNVKEMLAEEDWSKINGLQLSDLRITDGLEVPDGVIYSWDELVQKINEAKSSLGSGIISFKTYSAISEVADTYNEIFKQTSEIVANNTEVTQDYKDALVELVGSEEKVSECFYDDNKLVVKNADGLNDLLKETKKNIASNAKLAKSQSRLEYYDLYKQIRNLVNGKKVENQATLNQIYALYDQMSALERSIAKYAILEQQLLGTANAYDKFVEAQDIDAETDYTSQIGEMVSTVADAFNTGKLGTEAAQAAFEGIIPESVYDDIDTLVGKMDAAYEYFTNGEISRYFSIEFDDEGAISSVETTLEDVQRFVQDGIDNGVFTGTWENFDLTDGVDSLTDVASAFNITEDAAFALFNLLEDYDISWIGGDMTTLLEGLLGDDLEYKIYNTIDALSELEIKIAEGTATEEDFKQYSKLNTEMSNMADIARDNADAYTEQSNKLAEVQSDVEKYTEELQNAKDAGANWDGRSIQEIEADLNAAAKEAENCGQKLAEIDAPSALELQLIIDDAQAEIDAFQAENSTLLTKVEIAQNEEGEFEYEAKVGVKLSEEDKQELDGYVEDLNAKLNAETMLGEEPVTAEEHLSTIEELLQNIKDIMTGDYKEPQQENTTSDSKINKTSNTDESDSSNNISDFFTETIPNVAEEIGDSLETFFTESIPDFVAEIQSTLEEFFTETVPETWDDFWNSVGEFISDLASDAQSLYNSVVEYFTVTLPENWNEFWDGAYDTVTETIPFAIGYVARVIYDFFTIDLPKAWNDFWQDVRDALDNAYNDANSVFDVIQEFITKRIPEAWNNFCASVSEFFNTTVSNALTTAINAIVEFGGNVASEIVEFWNDIVVFVTQTIPEAIATITSAVTTFFTVTIPNAWDNFLDDVGNFITTTIPNAVETIGNGVTTFFTETLPGYFTGLWGSISSWISTAASDFWENLKSGWNSGGEPSTTPKNPSTNKPNGSGVTRVNGTANAKGSFGAPKTETSLVGELGPEMVVRGNKWFTVGENGAEFTDIKKGDIIFNHKQTEELLSNGYVTSRGKAYASGTAYAGVTTYTKHVDDVSSDYRNTLGNAGDKLSDAADNISDAADEFEEVFDWIEVRLEEINEDLDRKSAQLENKSSVEGKNKVIDEMIDLNKDLYDNLKAGATKYNNYAAKLLKDIPPAYREAAQDGSIAIETFIGEVDEETLEAIQNYRDWAQKGADAATQAVETLTEIAQLAKQKFDNIADRADAKIGLKQDANAELENSVSLLEEQGEIASPKYYEQMKKNTNAELDILKQEREDLQASLNESVANGDIKKYSDEWYEMVSQINAVDQEIGECKISLEEYQNAINQIHWDRFDQLMTQYQNIADETDNLIDLMSNEDMFTTPDAEFWGDKDVKWTEEGITTLGLYAQQMENAEYQAQQYENQIAYLNKAYAEGKYSEAEYAEKLAELKDGQYDSIQAYNDAKDAIVDLNKERIEAVKEGIEKEIEAYSELIEKKKEELNAEKDLYDFQKSTMEQQKNIADIQRKLAALSGDNSASAVAERKRLEAELAEANAELEDSYYERSMDQQEKALDNELTAFEEEKNAEIEKLDQELENAEQIVAESLDIVKANTEAVYDTLKEKAGEYDLTLSDAVINPWASGSEAIDDYDEKFGNSKSATIEALEEIKAEWKEINSEIDKAAGKDIKKHKDKDKKKTIKVGGNVNAKGAKIYDYKGDKSGESQYYGSDPRYKVLQIDGNWIQVRHKSLSSGITGWFKKKDVKAYAKGTKKTKKDQLALIDELGEELVLMAGKNGKLAYLTKGSSVIPSDISENLMKLGQLDPSEVLKRNKPSVGASASVINNNMEINMQIAEVVHIDKVTNDTLPDLTKAVEKQMDSYMAKLNNSLKKFAR